MRHLITLKTIRQKLYRTQGEASEVLGISPYYLSMIERGDRRPGRKLIEKMATVYGRSFDDIFYALEVQNELCRDHNEETEVV
jgi:transcriptional regulator with XRE-family HTH domain